MELEEEQTQEQVATKTVAGFGAGSVLPIALNILFREWPEVEDLKNPRPSTEEIEWLKNNVGLAPLVKALEELNMRELVQEMESPYFTIDSKTLELIKRRLEMYEQLTQAVGDIIRGHNDVYLGLKGGKEVREVILNWRYLRRLEELGSSKSIDGILVAHALLAKMGEPLEKEEKRIMEMAKKVVPETFRDKLEEIKKEGGVRAVALVAGAYAHAKGIPYSKYSRPAYSERDFLEGSPEAIISKAEAYFDHMVPRVDEFILLPEPVANFLKEVAGISPEKSADTNNLENALIESRKELAKADSIVYSTEKVQEFSRRDFLKWILYRSTVKGTIVGSLASLLMVLPWMAIKELAEVPTTRREAVGYLAGSVMGLVLGSFIPAIHGAFSLLDELTENFKKKIEEGGIREVKKEEIAQVRRLMEEMNQEIEELRELARSNNIGVIFRGERPIIVFPPPYYSSLELRMLVDPKKINAGVEKIRNGVNTLMNLEVGERKG